MKYILGIDTGGTYTDSVLLDAENKRVLQKQKVLTTPHMLQCCIENTFRGIRRAALEQIAMVCLSTTLATNSVVENRGCREGVILIGAKPNGRIPTGRYAVVRGRYDIKGRIQENLDAGEVARVVESFRGQVDAIAVSGYASVRNPAHERYVKKVIEERLGIPVVCAHELTSDLGYYERTVTAALNARLIPLVYDLISAVKAVMKFYGVRAPLMIVKGDGHLMSDATARRRPIETILSGPAASVIGGIHLSGESDCFVLDIGGTTTDIANVRGGRMQIRNDGAKVGGWFTRVRAAEVFTVGVGGDSRIAVGRDGRLHIGPEQAMPLCRAAERYPALVREMADIYVSGSYKHFLYHDDEAFILRKEESIEYSDNEKILIEVLRSQPHTLSYLAGHIRLPDLRAALGRLVAAGVLRRIAVTPTDILHVTGEYRPWNWVLSELGVKMLAGQSGMRLHQFIVSVKKEMARSIERALLQAALYFDRQESGLEPGGEGDYFIDRLFFGGASENLGVSYRLRKKVVAIGAPAQAWLRGVGGRLAASIEVPEHAEVANALGAAVGRQIENLDILIRRDAATGQYIVFSPLRRTAHGSMEAATEFAQQEGEECVRRAAGGNRYGLTVKVEDLSVPGDGGAPMAFVERVIHISAVLQEKDKENPE